MKNKFALVLLFIAMILVMFTVVKAQSNIDWENICESGMLNISTLNNGTVLATCLLADLIPTPTDMPLPTETLMPTEIPGIPGDPYIDAPLCVMHDMNAYHTLWNSELGCHYDHQHGDNPHDVDNIFGTQAYEWMGGEVSYPWQTFSAAGLENNLKHYGYIWVVRTPEDIGTCYSQYGDGCFMAFRSLVHFLASDADAKVLYHSVWTEALVCTEANSTDCGIIRHGGWQYTGDLYVDDILIKDELPPLYRAPQANKLHYTNSFATWYPVTAYGRTSIEVGDMWGLVDTSTPDINVSFFCYGEIGCEQNGSMFQPHVLGFGIGQRQIDSAGVLKNQNTLFDSITMDGIIYKASFVGYSDRYGRVLVDALGNPVTNCEIGLDCVPFQLDNITVGMQYQFRGGELENEPHPSGHDGRWPAGGYREYDIYFDHQSSGWIEYNVPLDAHH